MGGSTVYSFRKISNCSFSKMGVRAVIIYTDFQRIHHFFFGTNWARN